MKTSTCPKCGSKEIGPNNLKTGLMTGFTVKYVCKDCGYQGMPFIFDSEKEYNAFLKGIQKEEKREDFELIVLIGFGVLGTYVGVAQGTVGIMD